MQSLSKPLSLAANAAGLIGGVALLGLMLATVLDVVVRTTFNVAFLGITEITELSLVIVAVLGITYCAWTEGHVALEFGEKLLSPGTWRWVEVTGRLAAMATAGAVAFYSFAEAIAVYQRNAHTNLLQIPEYPFYLIVGLGFLTYALILLYRALSERDPAPSGPTE